MLFTPPWRQVEVENRGHYRYYIVRNYTDNAVIVHSVTSYDSEGAKHVDQLEWVLLPGQDVGVSTVAAPEEVTPDWESASASPSNIDIQKGTGQCPGYRYAPAFGPIFTMTNTSGEAVTPRARWAHCSYWFSPPCTVHEIGLPDRLDPAEAISRKICPSALPPSGIGAMWYLAMPADQ
jgi:hypothetical protein